MESISLSRNLSSLIILTRRSLASTRHNQILLPHRHTSLTFNPIRCTSSDNSSSTSSNTSNDDANAVKAPTATPPTSAAEISFRRRSRRQARRQRENESMQSAKARVTESPPKKWEDMTLSEKAMELYVGEKGALFWLNKFAYASIFIMIGGWILFRFVGPALNLYQLDGPLLAPSDVFK